MVTVFGAELRICVRVVSVWDGVRVGVSVGVSVRVSVSNPKAPDDDAWFHAVAPLEWQTLVLSNGMSLGCSLACHLTLYVASKHRRASAQVEVGRCSPCAMTLH
jgi:hypothetical protein